jgi:hypothetical protein
LQHRAREMDVIIGDNRYYRGIFGSAKCHGFELLSACVRIKSL